jgi:type II secretory pathway component GspD/PulD (secretin)
MKSIPVPTGGRTMTSAWMLMTAVLLFMGRAQCSQAQQPDAKPSEQRPDLGSYQTLYLVHTTDPHEVNDIVTDLRNMVPRARIYYVGSENAISMRGTGEDFELAQRLLSEIDRPRRVYRLTYTIADSQDGKRVGEQNVALIAVVSEGKTILKQGSRVPIVTSTSNGAGSPQDSDVQYVDVGLNIEASLEPYADGVRLRTKIEQSSLADERPGISVADPIIRQTVLEATTDLEQNKPVVLGSLDVPGSRRQQEVEVVSQLVR